jgi:hypothetical protein
MVHSSDEYTHLVADLTRYVEEVQLELREALEASIPMLDGARACARALGLKRGLGWKIYAVATSPELSQVIGALPRQAGWELLFSSLRKARCPASKLTALEAKVSALQSRLQSGAFKRPTLRAIAAGQLENPRQTAVLLKARQAVREGCEAIYGIRCASQLGMYVIGAPNKDGRLSFVTCTMHEGVKRLRPGPPIALKSLTRAWHPSWPEDKLASPLGACAETGWLVTDLSTRDVWENHLSLEITNGAPVVRYTSHPQSTEPTIRAVFAEILENGGSAGGSDDRVDIHFGISIPTAQAIFEAWVHRSILLKSEPYAGLAGSLDNGLPLSQESELIPLPLEARVQRLKLAELPVGFSKLSQAHNTMLQRAATSLRATVNDFVGFRVEVADPPIGARIRLRWRM